jgi:hypothetical protein
VNKVHSYFRQRGLILAARTVLEFFRVVDRKWTSDNGGSQKKIAFAYR